MVTKQTSQLAPSVIWQGRTIILAAVIKSSNVQAIEYDTDAQLLAVQFWGGATYIYRNITPTIYAALLAADSKGWYLQRHIVGMQAHPYERVR